MPEVNGKHFPYTSKGKKAAKSEALKKVKGKTLGSKERKYQGDDNDESKEKGEKESKKKMREAEN